MKRRTTSQRQEHQQQQQTKQVADTKNYNNGRGGGSVHRGNQDQQQKQQRPQQPEAEDGWKRCRRSIEHSLNVNRSLQEQLLKELQIINQKKAMNRSDAEQCIDILSTKIWEERYDYQCYYKKHILTNFPHQPTMKQINSVVRKDDEKEDKREEERRRRMGMSIGTQDQNQKQINDRQRNDDDENGAATKGSGGKKTFKRRRNYVQRHKFPYNEHRRWNLDYFIDPLGYRPKDNDDTVRRRQLDTPPQTTTTTTTLKTIASTSSKSPSMDTMMNEGNDVDNDDDDKDEGTHDHTSCKYAGPFYHTNPPWSKQESKALYSIVTKLMSQKKNNTKNSIDNDKTDQDNQGDQNNDGLDNMMMIINDPDNRKEGEEEKSIRNLFQQVAKTLQSQVVPQVDGSTAAATTSAAASSSSTTTTTQLVRSALDCYYQYQKLEKQQQQQQNNTKGINSKGGPIFSKEESLQIMEMVHYRNTDESKRIKDTNPTSSFSAVAASAGTGTGTAATVNRNTDEDDDDSTMAVPRTNNPPPPKKNQGGKKTFFWQDVADKLSSTASSDPSSSKSTKQSNNTRKKTEWECFVHYQTKLYTPESWINSSIQEETLFRYLALHGPQFVWDISSAIHFGQRLIPSVVGRKILNRTHQASSFLPTLSNNVSAISSPPSSSSTFINTAWSINEERKLVLCQKIYQTVSEPLVWAAKHFRSPYNTIITNTDSSSSSSFVYTPKRTTRQIAHKWDRSINPKYDYTTPFSSQEDELLLYYIRQGKGMAEIARLLSTATCHTNSNNDNNNIENYDDHDDDDSEDDDRKQNRPKRQKGQHQRRMVVRNTNQLENRWKGIATSKDIIQRIRNRLSTDVLKNKALKLQQHQQRDTSSSSSSSSSSTITTATTSTATMKKPPPSSQGQIAQGESLELSRTNQQKDDVDDSFTISKTKHNRNDDDGNSNDDKNKHNTKTLMNNNNNMSMSPDDFVVQIIRKPKKRKRL